MFEESKESKTIKQREVEFKEFCAKNTRLCEDYLPNNRYNKHCKLANKCRTEKETKWMPTYGFSKAFLAKAACDKKGNIKCRLKLENVEREC